MEDEKDFFCLISLTEEDIVVEEIQTFELWDDVDQEVLGFVSEETDSLDDLSMGRLNNIGSQRWWQLLE